MRHREPRPASRADLILIGHVGFATDRTVTGAITYTGGSGFAVAFAAAALLDGVGLVAQVGEDFDLGLLRLLPIDMAGVAVLPGASATFFIDQSGADGLSFRSDLGVAAEPSFDLFPASYFRARYVHLGTAPPRQQLAWLEFLRDNRCRAQVSVDMFEPFVTTEPDACRELCDRADLIFLNEAEHQGLYGGRSRPSAPTILKHGPGGAEFLADAVRHHIPAPPAREVDPIGAGEILAGSFLALRARGLPEDRALVYAVAAATQSVTEFGVTGPRVTRELQRIRKELESQPSPLKQLSGGFVSRRGASGAGPGARGAGRVLPVPARVLGMPAGCFRCRPGASGAGRVLPVPAGASGTGQRRVGAALAAHFPHRVTWPSPAPAGVPADTMWMTRSCS
jgi:sugar/nucleoside kinase (ribokinase family)